MRINPQANFGTAVFIVEGDKTEMRFLVHVFRDLLKCTCIKRTRRSARFEVIEAEQESGSKVIIMTARTPGIISIFSDRAGMGANEHLPTPQYMDDVYKFLIEEVKCNPKDVPFFYIWDRDAGSNDTTMTRTLVTQLTDPYEDNDVLFRHGLLLLSYPCFESYLVSCFENGKYVIDEQLKPYVGARRYGIGRVSATEMLNAAQEMLVNFSDLCGHDMNMHDIAQTSLEAFDAEESFAAANGDSYHLLSLVTVAFVYLGIIEI